MLALLVAASAFPQYGEPPVSPYAWGWDAKASAQQLYITQPVDHFDASNNATWQQGFYVNATFWKGAKSDAPIFLYVGGEGPLSNRSVTSNFVIDWLPSFGSLMLGLEHRYCTSHRGASYPELSPPLC